MSFVNLKPVPRIELPLSPIMSNCASSTPDCTLAHGARLSRGKRAVGVAVFGLALMLIAVAERPSGEVLFTGLDDSAQSILARSFRECGASLMYRDDALASVPAGSRRYLFYRPGGRRTRDLAHQVDPATYETRPFFQPFFPLQRAFLPHLPLALSLAILAAIALGPGRSLSSKCRATSTATALLAVVAAAALTPWHSPYYLAGPFAEGPATLFAALALALAFAPAGGAARGLGVGLSLGLAVSFHPTLSAFAVPIAAFSIMRSGRCCHLFGIIGGAVAGLSPIVWSTLFITAPYGNFFNLQVLRRMIAESRDIAALATALAVAVPVGVVFAVAALSPRVRRFFERRWSRVAVAAASGIAIVGAAAALHAIPAASTGFERSADALVWSAPFFVAATVATLLKRRGAACALSAACAWAAIPFFIVQGQERFVGLWSLRRSLTPVVLCSLAAACAAIEAEIGAAESRYGLRWRRALVALAVLCAGLQFTLGRGRFAFSPPRGDSEFFDAVLAKRAALASETAAEPLLLFDSFRIGAPFAAGLLRDSAFCMADAVSHHSSPSPIARWLSFEAHSGRPAFVVSWRELDAPILEDGFSLVPDGEAVRGVLRRTSGKRWTDAGDASHSEKAAFLRVVPDFATSERHILDFSEYDAFPFGLRGGWAMPRRDKPGRWAACGAGFIAPVPPQDGEVEIEITAAWTPPPSLVVPGSTPPTQTIRLVPPFKAEGTLEAILAPGRRPSVLKFTARRVAPLSAPSSPSSSSSSTSSSAAEPSSGIWRIESDLTFDADGFPPRLAAQIFRIESCVPSSPRNGD